MTVMSGPNGETLFKIRDRVKWLLVAEIEMFGRIVAIRTSTPYIAVVKDDNGEKWLIDLAEVEKAE